MKNSVVRLTAILTALMLMCSLLMVHEAKAAMGVYVLYGSQNVGDSTTVMWDVVPGADHYDCTVKNDTTGAYPRPRARADGIDCTFVTNTPGKYKIWVGAIDANGEVIDHGYAYWTVDESACDHDWDDDGFCDNCGKECPHNHGVIDSIALVRERSATNPSDDKHEIVYQDKCKVCRKILRERTVQQVHTYDQYGNCTMCGHSDHCPHSRKTLVEYGRSYEQDSAKEHEVKILYSWVCAEPNCGEVIDQIRDSETKYILEKHTFSNGICIRCNYSKKNDPVSVSVSRGSSTGEVGGHIAAECTAKGGSGEYDYLWTITCDGAVVYSTLMWGNRASLTPQTPGQYRFSVTVTDRDTKETATATTDAITVTQPACGHVNTTEQSIGIVDAKRVSDKMHEVTYGFQRVCNDCHQEVGSWVRYEAQEHTFGASGSCTICGAAAPSACKHGSVGSEIISSEYISTSSDQMHYVVTTWKDYCNACGAVLNLTRETSITEGHSFAGSVCTLCHYAKSEHGCDHANTAFQPYSENPTISQQNDQTHLVKTRGKLCCADCGLVINDNDYTETYTAHTWSGNTCTACGYMRQDSTAPCTHASTTREQIDQVPKPESDERHVVITSYKVRCADCGAVLNERLDQDAYFYHTWNENTCVICGYVRTGSGCAHTSVLDDPVSDYHYTPVDGTQHIWSYTCRTICSLCDEVLQAGLEKVGYAAHVMNNHACTYCGYVDRVEVNRVQLNRWMNAESDQKHRITTVWHIVYSDGTAEDAEEVTYADHEYEKQTGYEAEHPHAIFRRCPCGYHPKTGATQYVASCPSCNPKQVTDNAQPEIEMIPLPETGVKAESVIDQIKEIHGPASLQRQEEERQQVFAQQVSTQGSEMNKLVSELNAATDTNLVENFINEYNELQTDLVTDYSERIVVTLTNPVEEAKQILTDQEYTMLVNLLKTEVLPNITQSEREQGNDILSSWVGVWNNIGDFVGSKSNINDVIKELVKKNIIKPEYAHILDEGIDLIGTSKEYVNQMNKLLADNNISSNDELYSKLFDSDVFRDPQKMQEATDEMFDLMIKNGDAIRLPDGGVIWSDTPSASRNAELYAKLRTMAESAKSNDTEGWQKVSQAIDAKTDFKSAEKAFKYFGILVDAVSLANQAGVEADIMIALTENYHQNIAVLDEICASTDPDSELYRACESVRNDLDNAVASVLDVTLFKGVQMGADQFLDNAVDKLGTGLLGGIMLGGKLANLVPVVQDVRSIHASKRDFETAWNLSGKIEQMLRQAQSTSDPAAYYLTEVQCAVGNEELEAIAEYYKTKRDGIDNAAIIYGAAGFLYQMNEDNQEKSEKYHTKVVQAEYQIENLARIQEQIREEYQGISDAIDYSNVFAAVPAANSSVEEISAVKAGVVRVHAVNGADIKAEAKAGSATYGHAPANATYTYMGTVGNYYLVKVGNGDQSYTAYIDKSLATLE